MKQKQLYTSPEVELMELKLEGVIATSTNSIIVNPFSGVTEEEWS